MPDGPAASTLAGSAPRFSACRRRFRRSVGQMRRVACLTVAFTLALPFAAALSFAAPGVADATPRTAAPVWSGLDARNYDGPIPEAGDLIAQTPLDDAITLSAAGRAYRILYSTPDIDGAPAVSTGAVFLPSSPTPDGGYPVIAWAHGTTGLGDNCTPSALPRTDRDTEYLNRWLDEGYAIVATDYVGLGTPGLMSYLSSTVEAHSTVDSVIAAQQMGLPLASKWAIVGQSQGAGAALSAANRASTAGLDYRGVVATGAPANIEHIAALAGPGLPPFDVPTGLVVYGAYIWAGFSDARADLSPKQILSPVGQRVVEQAETLCNAEMNEALADVQIGDMFSAPVSSIPGALGALTEYMSIPTSGYDRPIFLGQGLLDVDVPAPSAFTLYGQLVAAGQPVELHIYPDEDHSGTVNASIRDSGPFLTRIMR